MLVNFLKTIKDRYKNLNPAISMCYHMSDDELFVSLSDDHENSIKININYQFPSGEQEDTGSLFEEFIVDFEARIFLGFKIDDMYFLPGDCDEAVVFARDLKVLMKNTWLIKQATYTIIEI